MKKPLVIVVVGPTASGKTTLSIELAKKLGGEIVSADSMQIYQNMDIATAKPDKEEMQGIPHHLIGFLPVGEGFSVAKYKQMALSAVKDILSRGKQPIVVGGTGLYIDTLVKNTEFLDYEESGIRQSLEERCENKGIESLYSELLKIDPESAEKLHLNDTKRIIRALEVYYATGKTMSCQREFSHLNESEYDWCLIGINAENRQLLYDRINKRVDIMCEKGLIEEAHGFFSLPCSDTARQAIGYKEIKPYIDGIVSLEDALEELKRETRRYAKRQLTWFRKNDKVNWIYIDNITGDEIIQKALDIIGNYRS